MINLTRLNGPGFALNPDLIQKAEATPDTVVTLVDGTKYVVAESIDTITERVLAHRASVVALARHMAEVADEDAARALADVAAGRSPETGEQAGHPGLVEDAGDDHVVQLRPRRSH